MRCNAETDGLHSLRADQTEICSFFHGANKMQAMNSCAACKDHKQCAVEACKAWRDPDAERWTKKQKILVCGACKSDRGCTDKESP